MPRNRQDPLAGDTGGWTVDVGFGKPYILEKAGVGFKIAYFGLGLEFGFVVVLGLRWYDRLGL